MALIGSLRDNRIGERQEALEPVSAEWCTESENNIPQDSNWISINNWLLSVGWQVDTSKRTEGLPIGQTQLEVGVKNTVTTSRLVPLP
ncbi:uncharacterized protein AAG666_001621 isoform 2-T10 [Megaptera novaeangliae]